MEERRVIRSSWLKVDQFAQPTRCPNQIYEGIILNNSYTRLEKKKRI
jgi:hypothetical protein